MQTSVTVIDLTGPRSSFDAPPLRFESSVAICPPHEEERNEEGKRAFLTRDYHLVWSIPELRYHICTFLWAEPLWSLNLCEALDDMMRKLSCHAGTGGLGAFTTVSREMHDWWVEFQLDRIKVRDAPLGMPINIRTIMRTHTPLKYGGYIPNWWENFLLNKEGPEHTLRTVVDNLIHLRSSPVRFPLTNVPGYDVFSSYPEFNILSSGEIRGLSTGSTHSTPVLDLLSDDWMKNSGYRSWVFTIAYKRWDVLYFARSTPYKCTHLPPFVINK